MTVTQESLDLPGHAARQDADAGPLTPAEIAEMCHVARSTVYGVLNGRGGNSETAARIQVIVARHGVRDARTDPKPLAFTPRELQVLRGMAEGKPNAEIGAELFICEDTVKSHARRLFRKLGARDRAHAVVLALRAGHIPLWPDVQGQAPTADTTPPAPARSDSPPPAAVEPHPVRAAVGHHVRLQLVSGRIVACRVVAVDGQDVTVKADFLDQIRTYRLADIARVEPIGGRR